MLEGWWKVWFYFVNTLLNAAVCSLPVSGFEFDLFLSAIAEILFHVSPLNGTFLDQITERSLSTAVQKKNFWVSDLEEV